MKEVEPDYFRSLDDREIIEPKVLSAIGNMEKVDSDLVKAMIELIDRSNNSTAVTSLMRILSEKQVKEIKPVLIEKLRNKKNPQYSGIALLLLVEYFNWKPETMEEKVRLFYHQTNWEEISKLGKAAYPSLGIFLKSPGNAPSKLLDFLLEQNDVEALDYVVEYFKISFDYSGRYILPKLEEVGWEPTTDEEKIIFYIVKKNWSKIPRFKNKAVSFIIQLLTNVNYIHIDYITKDKKGKTVLADFYKYIPKLGSELVHELANYEPITFKPEVIRLLGEIDSSESTDLIIRALNSSKSQSYNRLSYIYDCIDALGKKTDKKAKETLNKIINSRNMKKKIRTYADTIYNNPDTDLISRAMYRVMTGETYDG